MISSAIVEGSGSVDVLQTIKAFCDALPQVADLEANGVLQIDVADSKNAGRVTHCYLSHRPHGPVELAAGSHASADARASMKDDALVDLLFHGKDPRGQLIPDRRLAVTGDLALAAQFFSYVFGAQSREDSISFATAEARVRESPPLLAIERITAPTRAMLDEAERACRPFITVGAFAAWPALRWTLDGLEAAHGGSNIVLDGERLTLAAFLQRVRASAADDVHPPYLSGSRVPPALAADFGELPEFAKGYDRPGAWMGAAGHVSKMHRDAIDGLLVQCLGRKQVRMYSPDQAELLYPEPRFSNGYQYARVDPANPDLAKFPRFAEARALEFVLAPGETLFVPTGWFHWIKALDHTVSIKFFPR